MKTKEDLIDFEDEIAALFNSGAIHAPIHLYFGNEDQIIKVFQNIRQQDWVFCSWRSHYQCLLKGVHHPQWPMSRCDRLENIGKSIARPKFPV